MGDYSGTKALIFFFLTVFCSVHQSYVDSTTQRKFFISVSCFPTTGCYSDDQVCASSLHLINPRLALHKCSKPHANDQFQLIIIIIIIIIINFIYRG